MTYDKEQVKEAVSLRELFERDGHELRRAGSSLVCRCPVHEEKTSSCHVHEEERFFKCFGCGFKGDAFDYWQQTRGVDFKGALEALAAFAGIVGSTGLSYEAMKPKAPKPGPAEELAPELSETRKQIWADACAELLDDEAEIARIASWRGYRPETVLWAAKEGLMGMLPFMGARREAFAVQRPKVDEVGGQWRLIPVGWHIRLGPGSIGNDSKKASWRYPWAGIGSWPFIVGDAATAKVIFCLEGQWDALALIDLMGWTDQWPKGVLVVGMRGATSWRKFLQTMPATDGGASLPMYPWPGEATAFCFADRDNAGKEWFEAKGFVEKLTPRVRKVWAFWPSMDRGQLPQLKDFNDVHKAGLVSADGFRAILRAKLKRDVTKKKVTFLKWCREQAQKRADLIGKAAWLVVRDQERPKGRKPLGTWQRHWARTANVEDMPLLLECWREWARG